MNKNLLFAIDANTEEVIVSDSPKGTNKINFIERIGRNNNEILYNAVVTLTSITKASNFDAAIFKAMDKVCQIVYNKHKETE
jgi:outer membrane lipoprotein-sorting protein